MKLRLRSLETKETLRIEVPNPCSLQHLREVISQRISSPSPSYSVHLSLNRKEELFSSLPEESIQSIGVTSGDLIYFTMSPNGFSSESPIVLQSVAPLLARSETSQEYQALHPNSEKRDASPHTGSSGTLDLDIEKGEIIDSNAPKMEETLEYMETDDDASVQEAGKSFSVPGFLRKVFTEELGDDSGRDHKLLKIAVHAVLSESGFVGFDPSSYTIGNKFHLSGDWPSSAFYYTLPAIISHDRVKIGEIGAVKTKFQSLGKFCKVYGSVVNGTGMHWVLLDEDRLVPFLSVVWANCGSDFEIRGDNGVSSILPEREVFEFWRKVKDGLALPLLIDLCEKAGLELPPCFMRLPTELKLKILESLPGVDIAKVGCLCSELRYLTSSEDLWKQKYAEQFGKVEGSEGGRTFKERFAKAWESRKRRKIASGSLFRPIRSHFFVPRFPQVIGGDYDIWPNLGGFRFYNQHGSGNPRLRNTVPHCNLRGLNG